MKSCSVLENDGKKDSRSYNILQYLFVIVNIVHFINIDGLALQSPFLKKIHDIEVNANVLRRPKKSNACQEEKKPIFKNLSVLS